MKLGLHSQMRGPASISEAMRACPDSSLVRPPVNAVEAVAQAPILRGAPLASSGGPPLLTELSSGCSGVARRSHSAPRRWRRPSRGDSPDRPRSAPAWPWMRARKPRYPAPFRQTRRLPETIQKAGGLPVRASRLTADSRYNTHPPRAARPKLEACRDAPAAPRPEERPTPGRQRRPARVDKVSQCASCDLPACASI
jgi:hypothetical protein